jgi:hypothetical protein
MMGKIILGIIIIIAAIIGAIEGVVLAWIILGICVVAFILGLFGFFD